MTVLDEAQAVVSAYLDGLDPFSVAVDEAAVEYENGKTWAILMRPTGEWYYLLGYVAESGWVLLRFNRSHVTEGRGLLREDFEPLGVFDLRINAAVIALTMMEDQP